MTNLISLLTHFCQFLVTFIRFKIPSRSFVLVSLCRYFQRACALSQTAAILTFTISNLFVCP